MKHINKHIEKLTHWQLKALAAVSVWLFSNAAFAIGTLPDADNALPDDAVTHKESAWDLLFWLLFEALKICCILVPAAVTIGASVQIYKAYAEAKDVKNGWGSFVITAIVGVLITVFTVAMGVVAYGYLDG